MRQTPVDFADYADRFPPHTQKLLRQMRTAIRKAAPDAQEKVSYGLPAFWYAGATIIWFAAHTKHIGFYPGASGIAAFKKSLTRYKHAKGSVQFPVDEPLPLSLVIRMVKFQVKERHARLNER